MTSALFEDPTVYAADDRNRQVMRALALGGVLQTLRDRRSWSVEQAAVHAELGHMTWRRMEDGYNVRSKTYTAVDRLFDLPFGTTKRALNDDLLMVQLIQRVGEDTSEVTTSTAAAFVERWALQTMSRGARQTVQARVGVALGSGRSGSARSQLQAAASEAAARAVRARHPGYAPSSPAKVELHTSSDIEAVAALLDRLTRRPLTPRLDDAVRALLAAMPDLIERSLADASEALRPDPDAPPVDDDGIDVVECARARA